MSIICTKHRFVHTFM